MNLISIFSRFPDQESCLEHLECLRWAGDPFCPLCGDHDVARKADTDRQGRWNCHGCKSSFNVLVQYPARVGPSAESPAATCLLTLLITGDRTL